MIRRLRMVFLTIVALIARHAVADEPAYSQLWGERGERWSADSRLPDFSYAGYHRGERPLPLRKPDVNVKDFGAVGDGTTDDTAAFRRALKEAAGTVIGVPAGRYVITDFLPIRDSRTVLQGERPESSILYFPIPLERIKPNLGATTTGRPTSNYSWSGGFLDVQGRVADKPLTLGETDCVLTDFAFRMRFIHDVTVTSGSAANVVMNGRGTDLALDHHRYAPHANLWTNLDAGAGTRLFRSGGGAQLGWHCGAWETFWSIRSDRPQTWPPGGQESKWGCDLMNLVGLTTRQPPILNPHGKWFEVIAPDRLVPANLYEAQLQRRLATGPNGQARH